MIYKYGVRQIGWGQWGAGAVLIASLMSLAGCDMFSALMGGGDEDLSSTASPNTQSSSPTISNPSSPVVLPNDVLANVNGAPISKADLEQRIQELKILVENAGQAWPGLQSEELQALLDELINAELMTQNAVARGLDKSLDVQRRWAYSRRGFFAQEWLRNAQEGVAVEAAEVEAYYEQNKFGFREPESIRVRQITVATEAQMKQALAQLFSETADFATLARQISLGPTAEEGGLLPLWVMRADEKALLFPTEEQAEAAGVMSLDPVLEAAAFAIDQVDNWSNHVKGADGRYHIFQLADRQEDKQRTLSEVYEDVKNFLLLQKLQGAISELTSTATIERFTTRLDTIEQ